MTQRTKKNNVRRYRRPLQLNIGLIIFGIIFIYILVMVILYSTSSHISAYEVRTGTLTVPNVYTGLILREEEVYYTETAGYVSYFTPESKRIGTGDVICAVSDSNEFVNRLTEKSDGSTSLSMQELEELKTHFDSFEHAFSNQSYSDAYELKDDLDIMISKYINVILKENLEEANESNMSDNIHLLTTTDTGIVSYFQDGYESFDSSLVTLEDFNLESYEKIDFVSSEWAVAGAPIYKLILEDDWSIVIPIETEQASSFIEDDYIKVRFLKNQTESMGKIHIIQTEEGSFIELSFTNSMITFSGDRFLECELFIDGEEGLKVPNTAIHEHEFYLIPKEYVTAYEKDSKLQYFVLLEYYNEDGVKSIKELALNVYSETDTEYYIDSELLENGDRLVKDDSTETHAVSKTGTLIGVYNINKGYADFTQISILAANEEYSIIKSNTKYGLSEYDFIVLEAETVQADDLLY